MRKARDASEVLKVKEFILEKALEILVSEGFKSLTMRNLGSKTKMTAPNLYNYFSNKDEIYITLVIEGYRILIEKIKNAINQSTSPVSRSRRAMMEYLEFGNTNKPYYDIMFSLSLPRYNEYRGTALDDLYQIELKLSNELALISIELIRQVFAEYGDLDEQTCRNVLLYIWSMLHGMVSFRETNIISRMTDNIEMTYKNILEKNFHILKASELYVWGSLKNRFGDLP